MSAPSTIPEPSTETPALRRERVLLRRDAATWLPTLNDEMVDRLVASAWLTALRGEDDDAIAVASRAAGEVRRTAAVTLAGGVQASRLDAVAAVAGIALREEPVTEVVPARPSRRRRPRMQPSRRVPGRAAGRGMAVAALLVGVICVAWAMSGGGEEPSPTRAAPPLPSSSKSGAPARAARPKAPKVARKAAVRRVERHRAAAPRPRARRRAPARARPRASRRERRKRTAATAAPRRSPAIVPAPRAATPTPAPKPRPAPRPRPQPRHDSWGGEFRP